MQSVYGLMQTPSQQRSISTLNRIGKPLSILLPALVAGLLQLRPLQRFPAWYFFTENVLC